MTPLIGLYYFCVAFVLAQLEIQVEGPHGWAERLPTWRWDGPGVRRWFGKPVTGYHLSLLALILLFMHAPLLHAGAGWRQEAELLSLFCLLTVCWDFLWFACNPHYGVSRLRPGRVWWFPSWILGLPQPYWGGMLLSALLAAAAGLEAEAVPASLAAWSIVFAELLSLSLGVAAAVQLLKRRSAGLQVK